MENCDGRNHGQKKTKKTKKKIKKKQKKTLKRNPEAKCMVCTWLKKYIWTSRVKKTNLSLGTFQIVLLNNLKKLKELYDFLNKSQLFENWTSLFYNLNQDV